MDGALTPSVAQTTMTSRHGAAFVRATVDEVRSRIATALASDASATIHLGVITLQPHQRAALSRITAAMREFGGALLADETGLGKTFVALALARDAHRPLVVAPAGLREMWRQAARSAAVEIEFISTETLSRRSDVAVNDPDLVIVDESHHFRNPTTARHRSLADLTARARVLLMSATPIHNSANDLETLLSLFLGARASTLDPAWTSRCIVRRLPHDVPAAHRPHVPSPQPLRILHDERHLDAILALPPPIPPMDGGDGGALLVYSLLRQWASTRAALVEALRRRLARATALLASLEAGRHPSASELAAWSFADGAVQLAFPELVVDSAHRTRGARDLATCVHAHAAAIRALLGELADSSDPDAERAAHLVELRARHAGEKIVVFSQYAESVAAMFRLLRAHAGVAALDAHGGHVAGGTLSRRETLARFAPRAQNAPPPRRAASIDMLLTTDLLSEGVNLQDASVLVHLDVPWTPARLDQRVGRIARLGSAHGCVTIYAMLPPGGAERIVRVEQRLREKLGVATRSVGVAGTIIPSLTLAAFADSNGAAGSVADRDCGGGSDAVDERDTRSPAELAEAIQSVLADWRMCGSVQNPRPISTPIAAAVTASVNGFIALIADSDTPRLIADLGVGATDAPRSVLDALRAARDGNAPLDEARLEAALVAIARWRSDRQVHRELSVDGALRARARRAVVDRIAMITRRAPRHLRPMIAALAATARRTATARYGAGAERVLAELAEASMSDEAWLRAVTTFGSIHAAGESPDAGARAVLAVLILSRPAG